MSEQYVGQEVLERRLGALLHYGSWLASCLIGLSFLVALLPSSLPIPHRAALPMQLATAGVVLFIVLPGLRVGLMLLHFLRARDLRLAITAAIVLLIMALGLVLGAL